MKYLLLICVVFVLLLSGCRHVATSDVVFSPLHGASGYQQKGDMEQSPYYRHPDFYTGKDISSSLLLIPHFRTVQQTSEYSCGPAALTMVMAYYGVSSDEEALFKEMDARSPYNPRPDGSYGASLKGMVQALESRGFTVESGMNLDSNDFQALLRSSLAEGIPLIVVHQEWNGHWMVIIGYDDMGSEDTCDDVLVLADPYDTTDHLQDGYLIMSFERFFSTWKSVDIMPEDERDGGYIRAYKK